MASIEIRYYNGDVETRELSRTQPISIGSHERNDICVTEDDVAVMHCRISWNSDTYEVAAAGLDGIELNGTRVRNAAFRTGDILRVGSVDIIMHGEPAAAASSSGRKNGDEVALKPLTEDEIKARREAEQQAEAEPEEITLPKRRSERKERTLKRKPRKQKSASPSRSAPPPGSLADALFDDDEDEPGKARDAARDAAASPPPPGGKPLKRITAPDAGSEDEFDDSPAASDSPAEAAKESLSDRLKQKIQTRQARPGERDPLRSPIVLGLAGGALALLLAAATFWFLNLRSTSQQMYDAALAEMGAGKYAQAIRGFEEFIHDYPTHELTDDARVALGKARVESQISGAAPQWSRGLESLHEFITNRRDEPGFDELKENVFGYGRKIAFGAAQSAAAVRNRDLLKVARDAEAVMQRYAPGGKLAPDISAGFKSAYRDAEAAIIRKETIDAGLASIAEALEQKQPITALDRRRELLERYSDFATDGRLAGLMQKTLDTEAALVTRDELNRDALTDDHAPPPHRPLTLALHTRARTAEQSTGRAVITLARDALFGVDMTTGEPLWRRTIGLDAPFFPLAVQTVVEGLLAYDTTHRELVLLEQHTGKLVWRQPLDEQLTGRPLILDGQAYVPTRGNRLYKIAVDSGRISTRLTFSQPLAASPVAVNDGTELLIAGEQAVCYRCRVRPLECHAVAFLGHQPGAITAPLLAMRSFVLICRNDRADSSGLTLVDAAADPRTLPAIATDRVEGHVRQAPVVRGKELYVTSSDERITAFTVSEEPDQEPLTRIADFQLQNPQPAPMYLKIGPDHRLWMASTAVRKFELRNNTIKFDGQPAAEGIATQPLQMIDRQLYAARRMPYSQASLLTLLDRNDLSGDWRTVLGAAVIGTVDSTADSSICLNENGEVFRVTADQLRDGGFLTNATTRLPIDSETTDPLLATVLPGGQLAMRVGDPEPALFLVNRVGQVERRYPLDDPLECGPVKIAAGIVIPLPGQLALLADDGGGPAEKYQARIEPDQQTRWQGLLPLDEQQCLAWDDRRNLLRIQFRSTPVRHLAEAARRTLDQPIDVAPTVLDDRILLADASGQLQSIDASTLETGSRFALDQPATSPLWTLDDRLYVETGRSKLTCFSIADGIAPLWSIDLDGRSLAGPPLNEQGKLLIALLDGMVWSVDPQNGKIASEITLHEPLIGGPQRVAGIPAVPSLNGGWHRLTSLMGEKQP